MKRFSDWAYERRRPLAVIAWSLTVIVTWLSLQAVFGQRATLETDWRRHTSTLIDFRDTVYFPGRHLADGGNPYDPTTYLPAHPTAQEFNPYAPAWLLLGLAVSRLSLGAAAVVYLALATIAQLVSSLLVGCWASRRWCWVIAPIVMTWQQVWAFTRDRQPSVFCILGVIVFLSMLGREQRRWRWLSALGFAMALVKPQFGIPLGVMAIACGYWAQVWRGTLVTALASVLPTWACVAASGGIGGFSDAMRRAVDYASSDDAMTGLTADSTRIDLVAMLARGTGVQLSSAVQLALFVGLLALACCLLWRRKDRDVLAVVAAPIALLSIVHGDYDFALVMAIPPACMALLHRTGLPQRTRHLVIATLCLAIAPLVHWHKVSMTVLGWSFFQRELFDVCLVSAAGVLGIAVAAATRGRQGSDANEQPPAKLWAS